MNCFQYVLTKLMEKCLKPLFAPKRTKPASRDPELGLYVKFDAVDDCVFNEQTDLNANNGFSNQQTDFMNANFGLFDEKHAVWQK